MTLKQYLTSNGLSLLRFSRKCKVSQPTLSRLVNGVVKRPRTNTIWKICKATKGLVDLSNA